MRDGAPVLLIASVSAYEAEQLERALEPAGWGMARVGRADEARQLLDRLREGVAVLVIDAGVLEMPHDGQWRRLRESRPALGTIVRCLLPQNGLRERRDDRTYEVDPDDIDGLCTAVRGFCVLFRSSRPEPLQEIRA
ncbi:MAG TPA: hypothetical protein VMS55_18260 [Myxococcota bacterium]|nr:hypothetical protein [Myxococcota bacterium]